MKDPVSFFAPGIPKGQPRPRAFARKMGNKFVARVYEAGTAEHWKSQVAMAWKEAGCPVMEARACRVELQFRFPRPKAHYTKKGLRPEAPTHHTAKPDCDNAAKAVLDALTQIGAWKDDSHVAVLLIQKLYHEAPGCAITIQEL